MIDFWIGLPLNLRYLVLAISGLVAGSAANYLIYTWCYFPRPISPWAPADKKTPTRTWADRLPVLGWMTLRREREIHGTGFWIRPLLIELALAIAFPLLYWFESQIGGLLPVGLQGNAQLVKDFEAWGSQLTVGHAFLLFLLVAGTFIDFDEQTIPDVLTVPGTIIGLLLAACSAYWFLPVDVANGNETWLSPAYFNLPWAPLAPKWRTSTGLMTGLAIWSLWCFALADRRIITRKGFAKAIEFFFAGLVRLPTWKLLAGIWVAGVIGIAAVFAIGGDRWHGLLTSLVGLAVGGGIVWAIRIVAWVSMRREAMGFGDVTLMAMIGAFLGWQAALTTFFLAPFTSIAIVTIKLLITRETETPFGPYLSAGAILTVAFWPTLYPKLAINFVLLGPAVLPFAVAILAIMGVMLFAIQVAKGFFLRG
ncbi:prepilin peptidase [Planctomycetes bacterium K23_9]|uniref:Type 4 prepilin-like proteins leader peptide-processing enzyme n=1 Tax=Stieleria marina TaxID=1930275 RepID=A0A517NRU4_9BACT|nr:Type 4 prepilin-like proteins leader peptide-processing enzyme [Planctomycetes bacterium K23_9]